MPITADIGDIIQVTPQFTQGLTLPSDLKVRYSLDGTNYVDGTSAGYTFEVTGNVTVYSKLFYDDNTNIIDENGNTLDVVTETIQATTTWLFIDDLTIQTGVNDLSNQKYRVRDIVDDNFGAIKINKTEYGDVTIRNGTLDFGTWPTNQTWQTSSFGTAKYLEGFDYGKTRDDYSSGGTFAVGEYIIMPTMAYTDTHMGEIVRRDLKIDGFTAERTKSGLLSTTVDSNYTTLHQISGDTINDAGDIPLGQRGKVLYEKSVSETYDPNDSSTYGYEDDADVIGSSLLVGFEVYNVGGTGASLADAVQSVITEIDNAGGTYNDLLCHVWSTNNNDYQYVVEKTLSEPNKTTVLFRNLNSSVYRTNTQRYFLFTFAGHPAFLSSPDNPSDRTVFATENLLNKYDSGATSKLHVKHPSNTPEVLGEWRLSGYINGIQTSGQGGTGDLTLENLKIYGSTDIAVNIRSEDNRGATISLLNCDLFACGTGIQTNSTPGVNTRSFIRIEGNKFSNHRTNFIFVSHRDRETQSDDLLLDPSVSIKRNILTENASSSMCRLYGTQNAIVEENIFYKLRNSHGNALTQYQSGVANNIVRNNLFYNVNRAMSIAAEGDDYHTNKGAEKENGLRIYNNLFYTDDDTAQYAPSQPCLTWLQNQYPRSSSYNDDQRNQIFNNSFYHDRVNGTYILSGNDTSQKYTTIQIKEALPPLDSCFDGGDSCSLTIPLLDTYRNFSSDGFYNVLKEGATGPSEVVNPIGQTSIRSYENYMYEGFADTFSVFDDLPELRWDGSETDLAISGLPVDVGFLWKKTDGSDITKSYMENVDGITRASQFFDNLILNTPPELPSLPVGSALEYVIDGDYYQPQDNRGVFGIYETTLSTQYPVIGTDDLVELSFYVGGGTAPYLTNRQWSVNGATVGGNADFFNTTAYNAGDTFNVVITSEDGSGATAEASSVTGVIVQPVSVESVSLSPPSVGYTGEVEFTLTGLTGSPLYDGTTSTGSIQKSYVIISGSTTAGPQSGPTFDLGPLGLTAGLTLTGYVVLTNNGGSTTANANTINVIDPNAPSDYDTYALAITEIYNPTTSIGQSGFTFASTPVPAGVIDDMTSGRWINTSFQNGGQWQVRADTSSGGETAYAEQVPYAAAWSDDEKVWYVGPYVQGSYQESLDDGAIVDGTVAYDFLTGTAETAQLGSTAPYSKGSVSGQPYAFVFLSEYTSGDVSGWTAYQG